MVHVHIVPKIYMSTVVPHKTICSGRWRRGCDGYVWTIQITTEAGLVPPCSPVWHCCTIFTTQNVIIMIKGTKQCTAMASYNQRYIYIVIRHFWPIPVDNWHHKKFYWWSVSVFGMYTARMLWFSTHKSSRLHNPHSPDDLLLISDFLLWDRTGNTVSPLAQEY